MSYWKPFNDWTPYFVWWPRWTSDGKFVWLAWCRTRLLSNHRNDGHDHGRKIRFSRQYMSLEFFEDED